MKSDSSYGNKNQDIFQQVTCFYDRNAPALSQYVQGPSDHLYMFGRLLKSGLVLDVGCGIGINANYLVSLGFSVIGVDSSKAMINIAKSRFPYVQFEVEDMRKMHFENASFDGIIASYSLIHLPKRDIPNVLVLLNSFLKLGGVIYISLQSGKSQEGFFSHPIVHAESIFLNIFSEREIKKLLCQSGFSIINTFTRRYYKMEHKFTKLFILANKSRNCSYG